MSEFKPKRLIAAAKTLNVNTAIIIDFLRKKGFVVEDRPTTKLNEDMYMTLLMEFGDARTKREIADKTQLGNKNNNIKLELDGTEKVESKEEDNSVVDTKRVELKGTKVLGKIALEEKKNKPQETKRIELKGTKVLGKIKLEEKKPSEIVNLEKILGIYLEDVKPDFMGQSSVNCYSLDKGGNIVQLNLSNISIEHIDFLNGFEKLKTLFLNKNKISKITRLPVLRNLEYLDLSDNNISKIENLKTLKSLRFLNLSNNSIAKIQGLRDLKNLELLYLENNEIKIIEGLANLTSLVDLSLKGNLIQKIENISHLIKLKRLDFSSNQIDQIGNSLSFTKFDIVSLADNKIRKINNTEQFNNIETLDLKANNIHSVDLNFRYAWSNTPVAKKINLFDNPLDDALINLIRKEDRRETEAYFQRLETSGVKTTKRLKLFLLGNTGAGKTTLADILVKGDKAFEGSTHGVNFFNYNIGKIEVRGYDFGGQDYYHNTHHAFFDTNALYVVVWGNGQQDTLNVNDNNEILFPLDYWLGSSKLFRGEDEDSSLRTKYFILQNYVNEESKVFLNQKSIIQDYNFIKSFKDFNLHNASDKRAVKIWIESVIKLNVEEKSILKIDSELNFAFQSPEIQTRVILSFDEVRTLQEDISTYDNDKLIHLLKSLHNILACYFTVFDERTTSLIEDASINEINQKVIVNIEVFTKWIYLILNRENLAKAQKGYFSKQDAQRWLEGEELALINLEYILAFMLHNKLIFRIKNDQTRFFAPAYLETDLTKTEKIFLNTFESPIVKYVFTDFFHTSIVSDIISEFYNNLLLDEEHSRKPQYVLWKNRIVLIEEKRENANELILISFNLNSDTTDASANITVSRYNSKVSNEFVWRVLEFVESKISKYSADKMIVSPKGNFVPSKVVEVGVSDEDGTVSNFILHDNTLFRRSDFKFVAKTEIMYPMKRIFISYSKYDEDYKEEFKKHTRTLQEEGLIDKPFDCGGIDLGAEWDPTIQKAIDDCDLMVCLVSVDFLNTDYIRKYEVKKAIESGKKLIPIIIKPCDWENSDFGRFQASLRAKVLTLNYQASLRGEIKENSKVEIAGYWTKIIKEMREKIFTQNE